MKHYRASALVLSAALLLAGCAATTGTQSGDSSSASPSEATPTATASGPDCDGFARWLNQPGIGPFEKITFPTSFETAWKTTLPTCAAEATGGGNYQEYLVLASVQQVHDGLLSQGGTVIMDASNSNAAISIIGTKFVPIASLVAAANQAQTPGFAEETNLAVTDDYSLWVNACGDNKDCQQ